MFVVKPVMDLICDGQDTGSVYAHLEENKLIISSAPTAPNDKPLKMKVLLSYMSAFVRHNRYVYVCLVCFGVRLVFIFAEAVVLSCIQHDSSTNRIYVKRHVEPRYTWWGCYFVGDI